MSRVPVSKVDKVTDNVWEVLLQGFASPEILCGLRNGQKHNWLWYKPDLRYASLKLMLRFENPSVAGSIFGGSLPVCGRVALQTHFRKAFRIVASILKTRTVLRPLGAAQESLSKAKLSPSFLKSLTYKLCINIALNPAHKPDY